MKQTLLCFRRSGMGFHVSRQRWHSIRFKGFSLLALNRDLSECILFLNINFRSTCTNNNLSLRKNRRKKFSSDASSVPRDSIHEFHRSLRSRFQRKRFILMDQSTCSRLVCSFTWLLLLAYSD